MLTQQTTPVAPERPRTLVLQTGACSWGVKSMGIGSTTFISDSQCIYSLGGKKYGSAHALRCYQKYLGSLTSSGPTSLAHREDCVLPKVLETIRNIIINGPDHSNFMTLLEDGDLGVCRLHFEVKFCVVSAVNTSGKAWLQATLNGQHFKLHTLSYAELVSRNCINKGCCKGHQVWENIQLHTQLCSEKHNETNRIRESEIPNRAWRRAL